ncbi:MAG TPA: hypothetical protein DCQ30_01695, partial [Acidimicrobiaceae bacterium]|nr:hypothetical protein [Acidimicrobiaceae bacterium]
TPAATSEPGVPSDPPAVPQPLVYTPATAETSIPEVTLERIGSAEHGLDGPADPNSAVEEATQALAASFSVPPPVVPRFSVEPQVHGVAQV